MNKLSYNRQKDVLIFVGDIMAKSTIKGSVSALDFLVQNHGSQHHNSSERIYAVRGNHDQLVVQWRAWREWFEALELPSSVFDSIDSEPSVQNRPRTGGDFLKIVEDEWLLEESKRRGDVEEWVDVERKKAQKTWREHWWKRIPPPGKGKHKQEWKMFGDHYWIAK